MKTKPGLNFLRGRDFGGCFRGYFRGCFRGCFGGCFFLAMLPFVAEASSITQKIDSILQKVDSRVTLAFAVEDLSTRKILYQKNARLLLRPASLIKTYTGATALKYLGGNFRFNTNLLSFAVPDSKGLIPSAVYLQFNGDPEFTSKNLEQMIAALHKKGVKKILGNLIIDNSQYDGVTYAPGWVVDDITYSYGSPLYSANIDKNKFVIRLHPGAVGHTATITSPLPAGVASFSNELITTKICHSPVLVYSSVANHYNLRGCLARNWGHAQIRELALRNTYLYARVLLARDLRHNGIVLKGHILSGRLPQGAGLRAHLLVQHQSQPLTHLVRVMLKKSDNLIANTLFKQIGFKYSTAAGTWRNGFKGVAKTLQPLTGIDFRTLQIEDGSGLSSYSLMSAEQMLKLLQAGYKDATLRSQLLPSLPIAGYDGTLQYRMRQFAAHTAIRAKTGSMTGVTNLAGYVLRPGHHPLAFVVLINGFIGKKYAYTRIQDELCGYLASL